MECKKNKKAERYHETLIGTELKLPSVQYKWASPVWHQYVVRSTHRNKLRSYLSEHGIDTIVHYPIPPHLQQAYKNDGYYKRGELLATEEMANEVLSLPIGPHLSEKYQEHIIKALLDFYL